MACWVSRTVMVAVVIVVGTVATVVVLYTRSVTVCNLFGMLITYMVSVPVVW